MQKLLIASALAQNTPIMLLDEPTAFLDPKYQHEIQSLLAQLRQEGKTIVTISHDINAAAAMADTIIALKNGHLLYNLPPSEMMTPSKLNTLYDTQFTFGKHPDTGKNIVLPMQS